jgi:hypothetical protein
MKKAIYQIRSGAYKTSKDYAHLKELLDAGYFVVCFVEYDVTPTSEYVFHDICLARKNNYGYELGARGIGYCSLCNDLHQFTFEEMCEANGVEFIEPTNISK